MKAWMYYEDSRGSFDTLAKTKKECTGNLDDYQLESLKMASGAKLRKVNIIPVGKKQKRLVKVMEDANEQLKICHEYINKVRKQVLYKTPASWMGIDDIDDIRLVGLELEDRINDVKRGGIC